MGKSINSFEMPHEIISKNVTVYVKIFCFRLNEAFKFQYIYIYINIQ